MNALSALVVAVMLAASCSAVSCSPSSDYYSHYYRVSLTSGLTGSAAKTAIQNALNTKYSISSSSLSSWSYTTTGSYVTFRVYYGFTKSTSETNTVNGLYSAQTSTTLRSQLGFSSCTRIATCSSSESSSSSSSSWNYSPYYQVSLTSGLTGTSAKTAIQNTLYNKYSLSSYNLMSWYYSGSYITFRIYYGSTGKVAGSAADKAAQALYNAQSNSTLRSELGFSSCQQTVDPNFGAAVAAAFGTLFIVLILIGVAIVICVIAIIVCCCCCTAKAVADASAPPQQVIVQQQPMMGQPGYAVQPGQVQVASTV